MQYLPISKSPWLTFEEFVPHVMEYDTYKKNKKRGNLTASCVGGNGRQIFIEFDSLQVKAHKEKVVQVYGDPRVYIAIEPLKKLVTKDEAARQYYAETYTLPNGELLPIEYQMKYSRQCDWLNAISRVMANKNSYKETLGISMDQFWENITLLASKDEEGAGLPTVVRCMRRKWKVYSEKGKAGLVEAHRFGNDYSRKVNDKIHDLILALNDMNHGPYLNEVCKMYGRFMRGELKVVHLETAEVFDPAQYFVKGVPYEIKLSTVKHYLNKKGAKAVTDKKRMSALEYNNTYRPHMMRTGPFFAFSKTTMDDTSSPFKMYNGDRPATYKMFDVASEALVTLVMHKDKRPDVALIRRLIADFVGLIARKGWKMPYEVEMERALTSSMKGTEDMMDVFYNGAVFPWIRWCAAKNPQEKRAEGFINRLKNGYHRHREGFQKRPFNKLTVNRANEDQKDVFFSFEEIEAFERADMQKWNNELHSDQETYKNMTRWQVLEQCQNPNLPVMNLSHVIPYVGLKTKTSVNRMRLEVQYNKYNVPETAVLDELNDRQVVAYYLPNDAGAIDSVFVYQDGRFICEAKKEQRFQEAKIEQTEDDLKIMGQQKKYLKGFDAVVERRRDAVIPVGVIAADSSAVAAMAHKAEVKIVEAVPVPVKKEREVVPVFTAQERLEYAAQQARNLM